MNDVAERLSARPDPTAYEQVTRSRLEALAAQVDRIETKINALLLAALTGLASELLRAALR